METFYIICILFLLLILFSFFSVGQYRPPMASNPAQASYGNSTRNSTPAPFSPSPGITYQPHRPTNSSPYP